MKNLAFNLWVLGVAVFGHNLSLSSIFGSQEFKKEINKEFTISSDGEVTIDNQFGMVNVTATDGDQVEIDVTIVVDTKNEEKAEDLFERIDIDFHNTSREVTATTDISSEKSSGFWRWLSSDNWNNDEFSINYDVKLPSTVTLNVENRHGDINIGNMSSEVYIDLAHGDGIIRNVDGKLDVKLAHGELRVGTAQELKMNVQHSEFRCEGANKIDAKTRHSDIEIDQADVLEVDSGHDDYVIGTVNKFYNKGAHDDFDINSVETFIIDSDFTDYEIDKVQHGGEMESQHGSLKIRELVDIQEGLDLDGAHADFRISTGAGFQLDLESSHADIRLPREMKITAKRNDETYSSISDYEDDQNSNSIDIIATSSGGSSGRVIANLRHGSLTIRGNR